MNERGAEGLSDRGSQENKTGGVFSRMSTQGSLFRAAVTNKSTDDVEVIYDKWAKEYVADTASAGYKAPENAAEQFRKNLPRDVNPATAKILDCACGTGLAGVQLMQRSDRVPFLNVHGLDFSRGMLEEAQQKPYQSLQQGDVLKPLDIANDEFDSCLCVGMFSGNVGPEALRQLMRIVSPGGIVTATVRDPIWDAKAFPAEITALEEAGVCSVVENVMVETMSELDTMGHCVTFKVL